MSNPDFFRCLSPGSRGSGRWRPRGSQRGQPRARPRRHPARPGPGSGGYGGEPRTTAGTAARRSRRRLADRAAGASRAERPRGRWPGARAAAPAGHRPPGAGGRGPGEPGLGAAGSRAGRAAGPAWARATRPGRRGLPAAGGGYGLRRGGSAAATAASGYRRPAQAAGPRSARRSRAAGIPAAADGWPAEPRWPRPAAPGGRAVRATGGATGPGRRPSACALATGGGFFVIVLVGVFYIVLAQTPIPVASQFATGQASRVYFRDGKTLVGMFGSTDRQILLPNQIPTMVKNAMVAAEDKHFYDEGGVSPTGIVRAAIADLTSGSVQQGGSTITQQLVRNYYDGHRHRGDRQPEDQGDLRRGEAGPAEVQGLDPHQVHEHGADRRRTCTASARPPRRTSASRSAS